MLVFKHLKYRLILDTGLLFFFLGRGSPGRSHSGRALVVASPPHPGKFFWSSDLPRLGGEHMVKCFLGLAPVKAASAVAKETKPENHSSLQVDLEATCKATNITVWQLLFLSVD